MDKLVKIRVPESKAKALEFFLKQKQTSIETELTKSILSIYERFVPKEVRAYVDGTKPESSDKSKTES